jgi:hypothetical protein
VRFRSVANVIAEALTLRSEWSARGVEFVDDIFGMHRPWLREFADRWRKEVALPFHCNLRADLLDDEMVELLARAGCRSVAFGVEAGSARVRNEVLVKDVSDQDLRDAAMRLRRARIRVITYNILGSPGETWDETWRTLTLNQELRPDYASVSLMQPYPSSKIYDIAVQHGLFPEGDVDRIAPTFHESTPLAIDHRREVANLQKLFNVALLWPRLTPLVQRLIRWPENRLFEAVFLLLHFGVFWIGVKRIPLRYLGAVAFNIGEIVRRHRSGLYRRRLPSRDAAPSLTEMIEKAAV